MDGRKVLYILLTTIYMVFLMYFSLLPLPGTGTAVQVMHNLLHIPAYGVLAYLVINCFSAMVLKAYVISFFVAGGFGVLNEFLQKFIPGRTASSTDILLNNLGIISLLIFFYFWTGKAKKYSRNEESQQIR